jgi:hypothetical protein
MHSGVLEELGPICLRAIISCICCSRSVCKSWTGSHFSFESTEFGTKYLYRHSGHECFQYLAWVECCGDYIPNAVRAFQQ